MKLSRKERIASDRAELLRKALVQVGYLTGREGGEEKNSERFEDLLADLMTDSLHLWKAQFGLKVQGDDAQKKDQFLRTEIGKIAAVAAHNFLDETLA